ncbi:MAG: exosortase C-terminal domain/associated protein EpsI [Desulfobacteraceae bacterium]
MRLKQTLIASCLLLLSAGLLQYLSHAEEVPPSKPLSDFPLRIDSWTGQEERFDPKVYEVLGVDDSILATYYNSQKIPVQLYVGFYRTQSEGDLIHSPKNCMPGGGWNIIHVSHEPLELSSGPIKVIKLILEKGQDRQVVLYWFQSRGRFISSEYWQKIYLVLDSIFKHRTDGSFVRLISPVGPSGQQESLETLKDFAETVIPILEEYLPS